MKFLPIITRLLITLGLLALIGFGIFDYIQNIDDNDCTMTYMRPPVYIPLKLGKKIDQKYSNYKLFYQCTYDCDADGSRIKFTTPGNIPVLFITGNADSHQQVRSIASLSLSKSEQPKYINRNINFNFYTISFNEEFSALYGPVLISQTNYVKLCIKHILSLYKTIKPESKQPTKVVIVGNSMGGLIARGLFAIKNDDDADDNTNFNASDYINTIITQATPHKHAVINGDRVMDSYYKQLNEYWFNNENNEQLENVILLSLYGGIRDILVRSDLANIKTAKTLSKLSTTIPYVWRSIDHRCMAWCKELVLVANRALFKLIDQTTGQIIEDRNKREEILYNFFNNDASLSLKPTTNNQFEFDAENMISISNINEINLNINKLNKKSEIVYVFEMNKLVDDFKKQKLNSLFIYTNILTKLNTYVLCKQLDTQENEEQKRYKCQNNEINYLDLYKTYNGYSIPPNELGRSIGLKVLNVENILDLITKFNYNYFIIKIPIWKKSEQVNNRYILNLDWYNSNERIQRIDNLPSLSNPSQLKLEIDANKQFVSFKRYLLPNFNRVYQAFNFNYQPIENTCLQILNKKSKNEKLLSTNVQIKFSENENEIYYFSQITNLKSTNLTLRLTKNNYENNIPYIDVYIFRVEHLINDKQIEQNEAYRYECGYGKHTFELSISFISVLGQLIRFYSLLLPAFLIVVMQLIDLFHINFNLHETKYFLLQCYLSKPRYFILSFTVLTLLTVGVLELNVYLADLLPPLFKIDFYYVEKSDQIFIYALIPILLAASYTFISLQLYLLSLLLLIKSTVLKLVSKVVNFLLNKFKFIAFACIAINVVLVSFSSVYYVATLAHVLIFYIELVRIILSKGSSKPLESSQYTRLVLLYFLILLKIPALLVWLKQTEKIDIFNLKPLSNIIKNNTLLDIDIAFINIFIYAISHLRIYFGAMNKLLKRLVNARLLSALIGVNMLLTLFYSTVNIYRLPYFLLVHLFFMLFYNEHDYKKTKNADDTKKKKDE